METNHRYCAVSPKISAYVRTVLAMDSDGLENSSDLPVVTNGMSAFIYKEYRNEYGLRICGQSTDESEWILNPDTRIIAIFFKPFALGTIFKLDARWLKQHAQGTTFESLDEKGSKRLLNNLRKASSLDEKIEVLTAFISARIESNKAMCETIRFATDHMMENSNPEVIGALLDELNISERTFQRVFKKYVGITPNEYRRICQFQQAFLQLRSGRFENLSDVAYANGYFDQSHYIRSFKEFAEITPHDYLQDGLTKK